MESDSDTSTAPLPGRTTTHRGGGEEERVGVHKSLTGESSPSGSRMGGEDGWETKVGRSRYRQEGQGNGVPGPETNH